MIRIPQLSRRRAIRTIAVGGATVAAAVAARVVIARVQVEDYRGARTSDREAIDTAIRAAQRAGGGEVHFAPRRVYQLGTLRPDETMFTLRDLRGVTFVGHGAKLNCETIGNGQTQLFLAQRSRDLIFRDLFATDRGADLRREWRGMDFLHCDTTAGPLGGITLAGIDVDGAVSVLTVTGQVASIRATGFLLDRVTARNCYYGLSFEENGDQVRGNLVAQNCRRPYIAYGVRDHTLDLTISHDGRSAGGDAALLVKRYLLDTARINLTASFAGVLAWRNLVKLEQQPPHGQSGSIDDVTLNLLVAETAANPYDSVAVGMSAYRNGRQVENSDDMWRRTVLRGCLGPVQARTRYYTRSRKLLQPLTEELRSCR